MLPKKLSWHIQFVVALGTWQRVTYSYAQLVPFVIILNHRLLRVSILKKLCQARALHLAVALVGKSQPLADLLFFKPSSKVGFSTSPPPDNIMLSAV